MPLHLVRVVEAGQAPGAEPSVKSLISSKLRRLQKEPTTAPARLLWWRSREVTVGKS